MTRGGRREELLVIVDAAQRSAGVIAARDRGDSAGAAELLMSFEDDHALASGCLLLAELAVKLYGQEANKPVQECVQNLCLEMEAVLAQ